jgi:hypothetical protein
MSGLSASSAFGVIITLRLSCITHSMTFPLKCRGWLGLSSACLVISKLVSTLSGACFSRSVKLLSAQSGFSRPAGNRSSYPILFTSSLYRIKQEAGDVLPALGVTARKYRAFAQNKMESRNAYTLPLV